MSQPFTEEFLNDFIDGKLSGEQLLRAERLLRENDAFREQVETYRAIGQQIKSLPRKSLPADFSETIIKSLESTLALGNGAATETIRARRNRFWRNGLIAGALAASFLLGMILIQNPPNKTQEIAWAPKEAATDENSAGPPTSGSASELRMADQKTAQRDGNEIEKDLAFGKEGAGKDDQVSGGREGIRGVDPNSVAQSKNSQSDDQNSPALATVEEKSKAEAPMASLAFDRAAAPFNEESSAAPRVANMTTEPAHADHWLVEMPESPAEREKLQQTLARLKLRSRETDQEPEAPGGEVTEIFEISGTAEAVEGFRQILAQFQTVKELSLAEAMTFDEKAEPEKTQAPKYADSLTQGSANNFTGKDLAKSDETNEPAKDKIPTVGAEGGIGELPSVDVKFIGRRSAANSGLKYAETDGMKKLSESPPLDFGGGGGRGGSGEVAPSGSFQMQNVSPNRSQASTKRISMDGKESPTPGIGGVLPSEPAAPEAENTIAGETNKGPTETRRVRIVIQSKSKTSSADPSTLPAEKK